MARRPECLPPGRLYHVIVRGNQWGKTFLNEDDYQSGISRNTGPKPPKVRLNSMIGYVLIRKQGYGLGEVAKYMGRDPGDSWNVFGASCGTDR
jgi:hypothetical protein